MTILILKDSGDWIKMGMDEWLDGLCLRQNSYMVIWLYAMPTAMWLGYTPKA